MRSKILAGASAVAVAFLLATHPAAVQAARLVSSAQIEDGTIHRRDIAPKTWRALQDQKAYRFPLVAQDPAPEIAYHLTGLPPGEYVFSYHVFALEQSPAATMFCAVKQSDESRRMLGFSYAVDNANLMTVTGGGAIRVTEEEPRFTCSSASDTFEISDADTVPSFITLTRVDSLTTSVADPAQI